MRGTKAKRLRKLGLKSGPKPVTAATGEALVGVLERQARARLAYGPVKSEPSEVVEWFAKRKRHERAKRNRGIRARALLREPS